MGEHPDVNSMSQEQYDDRLKRQHKQNAGKEEIHSPRNNWEKFLFTIKGKAPMSDGLAAIEQFDIHELVAAADQLVYRTDDPKLAQLQGAIDKRRSDLSAKK